MIKGLARRLNEAGKIKIGRKGKTIKSNKGNEFRPPERLDHFIITTTEKDADGDLVEDVALMNRLKAIDVLKNSNGDLINIPIRFLYDDTELNFPTRMARYDGAKLVCEGNGETARRRLDDFKSEITCPCKHAEPNGDGVIKCKHNGALTCIIDEAGLFGQVHKFRTTSKNSVMGILGGIDLIKTATRGKIAGLPLVLTLNNKSTITPSGVGTTVQIVSLCYRGSMADLQNECLQIAQRDQQFLIGMQELEEQARAAGAGVVVDSGDAEDERDFQEEFYPDSIIDGEVIEDGTTESGTSHGTTRDQPGATQENAASNVSGPVSSGQGNEPETVNSRDLLSDDQKKIAAASIERTEKEVKQIGLLNRLIRQPDSEKAVKLAKRLDKPFLIKFLAERTPIEINDDSENKPVYLGLAEKFIMSDQWPAYVQAFLEKDGSQADSGKDDDEDESAENDKQAGDGTDVKIDQPGLDKEAQTGASKEPVPFDLEAFKAIPKQWDMVLSLRESFPDRQFAPTQAPSELIKLAEEWCGEQTDQDGAGGSNDKAPGGQHEVSQSDKAGENDSSDDPNAIHYAWDDGEPVERSQLTRMVEGKSKNKIDDGSWFKEVSKYKDRDGNPLEKATQMTKKQAEHFLIWVEVPF